MSAVAFDSEVLTLSEAAEYLRLTSEEVGELAERGRIPGRRVSHEWRFSKAALEQWLARPAGKSVLLSQLGALADDPYLDQVRESAYRERGRPETEQAGSK
jgi:excisionase family DNA binding protein